VDFFTLRNRVNKAIGGPAVASIRWTLNKDKPNLILTLTHEYPADRVLASFNKWQSILTADSAVINTNWHKVLIHGAPTSVFNTEGGMDLIVDEIKTFNQGLEPVGVPYWLTSKERRQNQRAGTVVVAFKTEKEANTVVRHGISIAGLRLRAEKMLRTPRTSQCSRCLGFGHRDIKCRKAFKCRLCAEEHSSKQHKCGACESTELCQHIKAKCLNCNGEHTADSKDCKTYLTIRNVRKES